MTGKRVGLDTATRMLERGVWRLLPAVPFAVVLVAWSLYWTLARPTSETLPAVADVVATMWSMATEGQLAVHVLASLWRLLLGATLGILTGMIDMFTVSSEVREFHQPDQRQCPQADARTANMDTCR